MFGLMKKIILVVAMLPFGVCYAQIMSTSGLMIYGNGYTGKSQQPGDKNCWIKFPTVVSTGVNAAPEQSPSGMGTVCSAFYTVSKQGQAVGFCGISANWNTGMVVSLFNLPGQKSMCYLDPSKSVVIFGQNTSDEQ